MDPVVAVGKLRADVFKAHIAACVAASKRKPGGGNKDDDSKGSSSTDLISIVVHNEAIVSKGKTTWPERVCKEFVIPGCNGGPIQDFLGKPFTGIVLMYATDGMIRYQVSVIPIAGAIENMDKGEKYEVWLSYKPLLQLLSTLTAADNLILLFHTVTSRVEIIVRTDDACGEADGEDMPVMDAPEGSGLKDKEGYYSRLESIFVMDATYVPRHIMVLGAPRLVARLRSKQHKPTDVCTLSIKTSKQGSGVKSAVIFAVGDRILRCSKTILYFDRETADLTWIDCRDPMANALPIEMKHAAAAAAAASTEEEHPPKKIRFETANDFNAYVMGFGDDDDEQEMPEAGKIGEEMEKMVNIYNEADSMKTLTEFKFRMDHFVKALESICGDLDTVFMMVYIANDGEQQMALVDLVAPTKQSRGVVMSRFVSVQE